MDLVAKDQKITESTREIVTLLEYLQDHDHFLEDAKDFIKTREAGFEQCDNQSNKKSTESRNLFRRNGLSLLCYRHKSTATVSGQYLQQHC